ncbi:endogenous retrovirus group FC1 Env polyprotein-like [Diceros bicornis minor]|uniref:endogenous retrovirus group FC1 Env polyprotein-like n=1 Tax=Diceros bicornis minor TaxID=77932 RepID=UPI0026F0F0CA|nr:endogenous retrovirus group FC1 Env polyprotein-like [Diceros bicornis minor]XP_058419850.1 endogenous retrovirus group FC1 Env polyprotein-like [Diceros bicornis minor]XP_058419859.1 endogenous retrovirus group FC1 Env polyprotein-like [Diceros bicornis minor]XP_058419869.1 endogenous retrovirus group FC1 Env polyprotein-like [Diceros bicornis minor]
MLPVIRGNNVTLYCALTSTSPVGPVNSFRDTEMGRELFFHFNGRPFPQVINVADTTKKNNLDFSICIDNVTSLDAGFYFCIKFQKGNPDIMIKSGIGAQLVDTKLSSSIVQITPGEPTDSNFPGHNWVEKTTLAINIDTDHMYCPPEGYISIYSHNGIPWAHNCLRRPIDSGQCLLGTLIILFNLYSNEETKHWITPLKLLPRVSQDLPGGIPDGDAHFFGYSLLPWWGVAAHQHVLQNLSRTLEMIASETANSLTNLQTSLASLGQVVLDNRIALDYTFAEQGGVCLAANTTCCTYINTSSQVETSINKIREQVASMQTTLNQQTPLLSGDWFSNFFSWVPAGIQSILVGIIKGGLTLTLTGLLIYMAVKSEIKCISTLTTKASKSIARQVPLQHPPARFKKRVNLFHAMVPSHRATSAGSSQTGHDGPVPYASI